jgi:hypothetical protein
MAALLVLALVMTSMPARVWLFGACPVCGQIHEKILVVYLGGDPTPNSDPSDDPPVHPVNDHAVNGCFPPLPYCSTAAVDAVPVSLASGDSLRPQSDPQLISLPASTLIRPPRV